MIIINTLLFIDTETTGLSSAKHDLLEVCATRCHMESVMPIAKLQFMCNPPGGLKPSAQKINGITEPLVKYAEHPAIALMDLANFMRFNDIVVGHNFRRFDLKFLQKFIPFENDIIDTKELAAEVGFPSGQRSMATLIEHFNIDAAGLHRADADVRANIKIYKELIAMKNGQQGLFK